MRHIFGSAGIEAGTANMMALQTVQLAADLASFRNVSVDQAFSAIAAGLLGHTRALRYRFGIDLGSQAVIDRFGTKGSSLDEQIIQRFILLQEQMVEIIGDFSRTRFSPGNQIKLFRAGLRDLGAAIVRPIMPVLNAGLIVTNKILDVLTRLSTVIIATLGIRAFRKAFKRASLIRTEGGGFRRVSRAFLGFESGFFNFVKVIGRLFAMLSLIGLPFNRLLEQTVISEAGEVPDIIPGDINVDAPVVETQSSGMGGDVNLYVSGGATADQSIERAVDVLKRNKRMRTI